MFNVITCISLYYPASIGLTFYQQWFIRKFHFPLFVVFCHFIIKYLLSCVVRLFNIRCRHHDNVRLRWGDILTKVAPTGIAAAADIGLSNWSYRYVTISLPKKCIRDANGQENSHFYYFLFKN
uniref:Uncharacterized protein n=1 Tax=Romanomermis culicivorax TaxID=13658 RepID=A0A915KK42_ROMCU